MTTFNSKETYLAYRSNWKAQYKNLSNEIRQNKADIREAQKNRAYAGSMQYAALKYRKQATAMIDELKEAKAEAQRQYLAAKTEMKGCCLMAMA